MTHKQFNKMYNTAILALFCTPYALTLDTFVLKNGTEESVTVVLTRKDQASLEVITNLKSGQEARPDYEFVAEGGKPTHRLAKITIFKGQAGTDNKVPVSTFPAGKLPAGGKTFGIPQKTWYLLQKATKEGQETYVLYGIAKKPRPDDEFLHYHKVVPANDTFEFEQEASLSVKRPPRKSKRIHRKNTAPRKDQMP